MAREPRKLSPISVPRAPIGEAAQKAMATWGPERFAYHAPTALEKSPFRMMRPRGGKGPRNATE
jgi:hypothetical protein